MNERPFWRRAPRLHTTSPRTAVREEFAFHLEERTEALVAKGMSEQAARELALRQFGDLPGATEICTDIGRRRARRVRWQERLESVAQDFRYALTAMRRAPGFTVAAVSTIALGIGANTVVFSLLNALLIQPLDARNPRELVRVYTSQGHTIRDERDRFGASSYADFMDLRRSPSLSGLAAFMPLGAAVDVGGASSRVEGRVVSNDYFDVLGRPLFRGGWSTSDPSAGTPSIVVSYHFWKNNLGGDPSAVGRTIGLNGHRALIVGISAEDFRGVEPSNVDVYLPFVSAPQLIGRPGFLEDRGERSVKLLGRLALTATPEATEDALNSIMSGLGAQFPQSNAMRVVSVRRATSIVPVELLGRGLIPTAGLLFTATLVMLAISGVNIAAVLLARTIKRRRELAVRRSLGAGPLRLARQLLTESVALALIAGTIVIALVSLLPVLASRLGVPPSVRPTLDGVVLGYAIAVAVGFGILFGLGPAIIGIRSAAVDALRSGEGDARPARARAQQALVCCQLALSMLLLIVGGALLGSLDRQQRVDPGFAVDQLVVANFEDPSGTVDVARERAFTQLAVQRLSVLPGVTSVSVGSMAPLTGDGYRSTIHIPGYVEHADEDMQVQTATAGPDFFRTLRIPILSGRELTWAERDTVSRVVVNRAMARRYWGAKNPVGTFVHLGGKGGHSAEVIAVAGDTRFRSLAETPAPMFVIQQAMGGGASVLIRTRSDASALMHAVRGSMARNDVPLTLVQLRTMEEILKMSLVVTRAVSDILMTIGVLAILLAAVGLYGVVSYVMAGRTREFGVRFALGADPASIARLVIQYGLRLAAVGGIAGTLLGIGVLQLLGDMLFGSWSSAPVIGVVGLVLGAVTLVACAIPAARATAISPASALRSD